MELTTQALEAEHRAAVNPKPAAVTALILLGAVGMEVTGVQPVLLGAMVAEGRLSAAGLGWATTAEFLTLALAITLAGAFLEPRGLRKIAAAAALVALASDLLAAGASGMPLIINRAIAGCAEGILVWPATCMIARSQSPARWAGIFLAVQCSAQLLFAALLPLTVMQWWGADGGFYALAGTALLALVAAPFIPDRFAELPATGGPSSGLPLLGARGVSSLVAVFLIAAFAIGVFAYLEPLAAQNGLSMATLGFAVSAALAAEIVGAVAASLVARHLRYYPALLICLVAYAAVLLILATHPSAAGLILAGALFGFFQVFFMPFQLPLVIDADPTRRSAVILPGIQLFGASAGPFFCSFFVTDSDARGALAVCAGYLGIAFCIATLLRWHRPVAPSISSD